MEIGNVVYFWKVVHKLKRCNRRDCRTAYFYGYKVLKGRSKEYDEGALYNDVLGEEICVFFYVQQLQIRGEGVLLIWAIAD